MTGIKKFEPVMIHCILNINIIDIFADIRSS